MDNKNLRCPLVVQMVSYKERGLLKQEAAGVGREGVAEGHAQIF